MKYLPKSLVLFCLSFLCTTASGAGHSPNAITAENCLYLPPSIADRVVFYDGFELPNSKPEINRINARISGSIKLAPDGFAGNACRSDQPSMGNKSLEIRSPRLAVDRPITVMRWWRVDVPMQETSTFQLLAFLGKGHISCFVHGKGEWCALQRPTMFVQVDHFPDIANVNWAVKDDAYFQPGDWHHIAITVANASEISFYLDGAPLVTVHSKGRLFAADDVDTLQAFGDGEHPTSTDELVVLDRVLSAQEIEQYCTATRRLSQMKYSPLLAEPKLAASANAQ